MSRSKIIIAVALVLSLAIRLHAQNGSVELLKTLTGPTKSILEIAFSPRGEIVAASSEDGAVRFWSVATGESLGTIVGPQKTEPAKLSWSSDERRLAITYRIKKSWELVVCEISPTHPAEFSHRFPVADFVEWSPDNRTFLAWDHQFNLKLWDAVTGHSTHTLTPNFSPNTRLNAFFVANGQRVVTGSLDGPVELWDAASGKLIAGYPPNTTSDDPRFRNPAVPLVSSDRRFFISGNRQVYEAASGKLLASLQEGIPLSFSPRGETLLTIQNDDPNQRSSEIKLALRTIADGQEVLTFRVPDWIADIYWSPRGEKIAIVGYEFHTRVFDTATGREDGRPYDNCWPWQLWGSDGCEALRFSADATMLLREKQPIRLWETKTGSFSKELRTARLPAVFSPTERLLATRSENKKSVLLWRF